MAIEQFQVALDGRERGAQFVGGIRDKALLRPIGRFDAVQHFVKGGRESPKLIAVSRAFDAARKIVRMGNRARGLSHPEHSVSRRRVDMTASSLNRWMDFMSAL